MARTRKLLSPRGRGRRALVPTRAEEPSRGGGVLAPPHFAGASSSPSPQSPLSLQSSSSPSSSPSPQSSLPSPLPTPSPTLSSLPRSPSPSTSSSAWPPTSSSSSPPPPMTSTSLWSWPSTSTSSSSAATEQHAGASWDAAAAEDIGGASVMASLAAASGDAVLQRMDLAEKEEGMHHKGNAPQVEGVGQNFLKAPLMEGVDEISIEKNLSVPTNTVDEDTVCDALMALSCNTAVPSSSTAVTSDGLNRGISSTDGDDDTGRQLANLAEEANKMRCIGDKEPLSVLASDFPSDSFVIQEKIKGLCEEYVSFRRSCRDGNCFYRSFIFSYLEQVVDMRDEEYEEEALRILQILQKYKMAYQDLGKQSSLFENHCSDFIELFINIMEWKNTSTRLVTSIEICKRAEHFEPFVSDMRERTLEQFCTEEVIKMGSEADHLQITALVDALGVPVSVLNIDSSPTLSSSGTLEANRYDFFPCSSLQNQPPLDGGATTTSLPDMNYPVGGDGGANANDVAVAASDPWRSVSTGGNGASMSSALARRRPHVTLLYRPGHYDILYPKKLLTGHRRDF